MPCHHAIPDVSSGFCITRGQFNQAIVAEKCKAIPALQVFIMFGRCLGTSQGKCSSAESRIYTLLLGFRKRITFELLACDCLRKSSMLL